MQGIGEILRKTREAKGITLDEVAETTKIRRKYLEAIEQEDFQSLPGEVYAKGFVTAYLKYLDIKERPDVVELMQKKPTPQPEASAQVEDEAEKERRTRVSRKTSQTVKRRKTPAASFEEKPLSKKSSMIIILSVVAIILLLALQWFYTKSQQDNLPPENDVQQEEQQNGQQQGENGQPEDGSQTPDDPVARQEPVTTVYDGVEMHLEILDLNANTTEQCWMQITVDGQKTELTMSEGQVQDLKATDSIQLNLGNAGVVKVTVNGQDLGTMGKQGQVVKREFKAEDYVTTGQ